MELVLEVLREVFELAEPEASARILEEHEKGRTIIGPMLGPTQGTSLRAVRQPPHPWAVGRRGWTRDGIDLDVQ